MKGRAVPYSPEELQWLEERSDWPRRVLHSVFCCLFERRDIKVDDIKALCSRRKWKTGRTGQFKPGAAPLNKGKRMPYNARSAATRFKKGQRPKNTRVVGDERISKDGYVEICVPEVNPYTGFEHRFVLKHRWLWEQRNGPVPTGFCLKCIDGNRQNTEPENWQAIPRKMLPYVSGRFGFDYDHAPGELKPTILAVAKLKLGSREKRRVAHG